MVMDVVEQDISRGVFSTLEHAVRRAVHTSILFPNDWGLLFWADRHKFSCVVQLSGNNMRKFELIELEDVVKLLSVLSTLNRTHHDALRRIDDSL
jgi:hypothetical protein